MTLISLLHQVSPTWLRMFPLKRSIDNMKDAVNLIEEMCKPCSEKWKIVPATKFCVDCQNFLCLQCETDHKAVKENSRHKIVAYELKELKTTPASNVSKFNCPQHKNLRFSTFCESHAQFLCNTCMESGQHMGCRVKNNIIETVRSITKSEAKLHVINHLKHDERNLGKTKYMKFTFTIISHFAFSLYNSERFFFFFFWIFFLIFFFFFFFDVASLSLIKSHPFVLLCEFSL